MADTEQRPATADEEWAAAVRAVVWEPVEPLFIRLAKQIDRWL